MLSELCVIHYLIVNSNYRNGKSERQRTVHGKYVFIVPHGNGLNPTQKKKREKRQKARKKKRKTKNTRTRTPENSLNVNICIDSVLSGSLCVHGTTFVVELRLFSRRSEFR